MLALERRLAPSRGIRLLLAGATCGLTVASAQEAHWSFRAPIRPELPVLSSSSAELAPIDRFVEARLAAEGLAPAPRATARELARRAALDLTGLPPDPEVVESFAADPSEARYTALIETWLASPAHAEHFAASWLDASRYADSNGYQHDGDRYAWPWRDWIVEALRENRRFDEVVVEMLAGDLLPEATESQRLATAFLRMHPLNNEGGAIPDEVRFGYVVDRVHTVATSMLGLTMACAQCHDHKLDPIAQREYYELFAFFDNFDEDGVVDVHRKNSYHQFQIENPSLELPQWKELCGGEAPLVMVAQERAERRETRLHERGAYDRPTGEVLEPGIPRALGRLAESPPKNRLGLARWIVAPENPLFARVQMNLLWQQIFGRGLVATSEDFGVAGEKPTHPALLDWLAVEWIESRYDLRAMLRRILRSETYRRSARASAKMVERDPQNLLYARSSRIRLSSFALRDQALALAGSLDRRVGGPPVYPYHPVGLWRDVSFEVFDYPQTQLADTQRRTLYSFWRRTVSPPSLFDTANRQTCVVRPSRTNTPLHALVLWNDPTYVEAARGFATRVLREVEEEGDRARCERLWLLATARQPTRSETDRLHAALARERARYAEQPESARALLGVGLAPLPAECDPLELAAWTAVAQLVLHLDEVLCRP